MCQMGKLILKGRHRLLIGDCTKPENIVRLFVGQTPSMMVTDPPYGVDYDPTWRHRAGVNKSKRTGKVTNDHIADWAATWRLFTGNVAYVWHGGLHAATVQRSLEDAGFHARAQIVWVKPRLVLSRGHYHWKHEPCYQAERTDSDPDDDLPDDACEEAWYVNRKGASARFRGGRKQTTVWNIGFQGEEKTHHGTQKPVECMARPIRNHGAPGDIIYDPFLGSGTTLIAAHRLGRNCYGCEIDPRYGDVILKRAEAEGLSVEKLSE